MRELPPDTYTGNGYEDTHLEQKKAAGVQRVRTIRDAVLLAVRERPMQMREIVRVTGLSRNQVTWCLNQYKGTYFAHDKAAQLWSERQNTMAVAE